MGADMTERGFHKRKSIRLPEYDYTAAGGYFVTICVRNHVCALGEVVDGEMALNACGRIADGFWTDVADHFGNAYVDAKVVMPNHVHAIIMIVEPDDNDRRGAVPAPVFRETQGGGLARTAGTPPLRREVGDSAFNGRATLGQIVGYYKYQTTKRINALRGTPGGSFWQRNFHEHIVRNEHDLDKVREYIDTNPLRWEFDRENPAVFAVR